MNKIIQIAVVVHGSRALVHALDDNGTVWVGVTGPDGFTWTPLPGLPPVAP